MGKMEKTVPAKKISHRLNLKTNKLYQLLEHSKECEPSEASDIFNLIDKNYQAHLATFTAGLNPALK